MLVSKRRFRAEQEEVRRLREELEQAHASLARYREQERELLDAVVAARVEARAVRTRAETEAGSVVEGARDEAVAIKAEARAQLAAAQAEISRLREVQRDLGASLEQSLEAMRSALSQTALGRTSGAAEDQAAGLRQAPRTAAAMVPQADKDRPAPVSATRKHRQAADQAASPAFGAATAAVAQVPVAPTAALLHPSGFVSASSSRLRAALQTDTTSLLRLAAIVLVCLVLAAGGIRWWRGSPARAPVESDRAGGQPGASAAGDSSAGGPAGAAKKASRGGAVPAASRVKVGVRVLRPVWLRAQVDGKESVARLVRAGEIFEFSGAVVLRAGDAGALLVSVNGGAHAPLGRDGSVLTRRFAAADLRSTADAGAKRPALRPSTASETPASTLVRATPALGTPQLPKPQLQKMVPARPADPLLKTQAPSLPAATVGATRPALEAASAVGTDEADVLRAHETYFEALRRGDSGQIDRLIADGFTAAGAPTADASGLPFPLSLRNASVEIRGVGAVVSGTAAQRISGSDGQPSHDQQLLFSEVWVKRDGRWQLMNVRFVSPAGDR